MPVEMKLPCGYVEPYPEVYGRLGEMMADLRTNLDAHGIAPEGVPELTVEMNRPDPFNPNDGCGDGEVRVHADGLVDKVYNLWNRKPLTFGRTYMASWGGEGVPPKPNRASY